MNSQVFHPGPPSFPGVNTIIRDYIRLAENEGDDFIRTKNTRSENKIPFLDHNHYDKARG